MPRSAGTDQTLSRPQGQSRIKVTVARDVISDEPEQYLRSVGRVFAEFGALTQDSGNVSYGVQIDQQRFFVKTAGRPDDPLPFLDHAARVALLRNAVRLSETFSHPTLPRLHRVVESPIGPLLFYEWLDGALRGVTRERRDDPESPLDSGRLEVASSRRNRRSNSCPPYRLRHHRWSQQPRTAGVCRPSTRRRRDCHRHTFGSAQRSYPPRERTSARRTRHRRRHRRGRYSGRWQQDPALHRHRYPRDSGPRPSGGLLRTRG